MTTNARDLAATLSRLLRADAETSEVDTASWYELMTFIIVRGADIVEALGGERPALEPTPPRKRRAHVGRPLNEPRARLQDTLHSQVIPALRQHRGSVTKAAEALAVTRYVLMAVLAQAGVNAAEYRCGVFSGDADDAERLDLSPHDVRILRLRERGESIARIVEILQLQSRAQVTRMTNGAVERLRKARKAEREG